MDPGLFQFDPATLEAADLNNDEILELIALFARSENPQLYNQHLNTLYSKYNNSLEMRSCEIEALSRTESFDLRTLRNFYQAIPTISYISGIFDVINGYQDDPSAGQYLKRFEEATNYFPDEDFLRKLLEYLNNLRTQDDPSKPFDIEGNGVPSIRRHLRFSLEKVAEYAPVPKYIRNFDIDAGELPELVEPTEEELDKVSIATLADFLVVSEYQDGLLAGANILLSDDASKNVEFLTEKLELLDIEDRQKLARMYKLNPNEIGALQNNPNLFRVYGPVNMYLDEDFSNFKTEEGLPNINVVTGGARMFSDMKIEFDPDSDEIPDTWFTGVCGACSKRILAYHHAVRVPHQTGGWMGCYCSWECVRDFVKALATPDNTLEEEPDAGYDPDQYNFYLLRLALIDEYEEQMNEFGIQDRDPEEE